MIEHNRLLKALKLVMLLKSSQIAILLIYKSYVKMHQVDVKHKFLQSWFICQTAKYCLNHTEVSAGMYTTFRSS